MLVGVLLPLREGRPSPAAIKKSSAENWNGKASNLSSTWKFDSHLLLNLIYCFDLLHCLCHASPKSKVVGMVVRPQAAL